MKNIKLGLLFLLLSFLAPPPSLAQEGGWDEPLPYFKQDRTTICVPKFIKNGKTYFSVVIDDMSRNTPPAISPYREKYYISLKEVFSALKKFQNMGFKEDKFLFGEKVKGFIYEPEGIKLIPLTPSEKIEIEKFIKELLSPKKDSSADETDKSSKK